MTAEPASRLQAHAAWRIRFLAALVQRDLGARYRAAVFGWLWPLLVQLAQLVVFTYVFAAVFRQRAQIPGLQSGTLSYGLWLFTGLIGFNALQAGIVGASTSIVGQPNLVKRVVFPLALLPLVPVLSAAVEAVAGFAVLVAVTALTAHSLHPTLLLVPIVVVVQLILTAGLAYFVAGLTAFVRDVPQTLGPLFLLLLYLTPILYPPSAVPASVRTIVSLNPISVFVDAYRALTLEGTLPFGRHFALATIVSLAVFFLGWRFFRNLRPSFGDVV